MKNLNAMKKIQKKPKSHLFELCKQLNDRTKRKSTKYSEFGQEKHNCMNTGELKEIILKIFTKMMQNVKQMNCTFKRE